MKTTVITMNHLNGCNIWLCVSLKISFQNIVATEKHVMNQHLPKILPDKCSGGSRPSDKGEGDGHPDPEIRVGEGSLGPSPGSATEMLQKVTKFLNSKQHIVNQLTCTPH